MVGVMDEGVLVLVNSHKTATGSPVAVHEVVAQGWHIGGIAVAAELRSTPGGFKRLFIVVVPFLCSTNRWMK